MGGRLKYTLDTVCILYGIKVASYIGHTRREGECMDGYISMWLC